MTAHEIFTGLKKLFPSPAHTLLSQVRNGTGFSRSPRTADALAISTWPGRGLWLAGIEIKVFRNDWKKELAQPEKADAIQRYCHYWYIAAPAGLVEQAELPETWGLIEADKKSAKIVAKAPRLEPKPLDMLLLCSVLRNVGESMTPADDVQTLAAEMAEKLAANKTAEHKWLQDRVREFEAASGVSLADSWRYGQIGEAVKFIIQSNILHSYSGLKKLQADAEYIARSCEKLLASFTHQNGQVTT